MLSWALLAVVDLDASWTRIALLCLIGAMLITLAILVGYLVRSRRRPAPAPAQPKRMALSTPPPVPSAAVRRAHGSGSSRPRMGSTSGSLAVAQTTTGPVGCPACRREFEAGVRFCPYDSRRLVPAADLLERTRAAGSTCPRCRRAYDAGIRFCPHDAEELIPMALWEATHGKKSEAAPTGVLAKICPQCSGRYDLATTFCGKDGAELVTIN
jgi:hypothetical protein